MKKTFPLFKYIQYALIIIFSVIGANIGSATVYRYEVIVNGILGLVILYLLYRLFLSSKRVQTDNKEFDNHTLFEFPENIFYIFLAFFCAAIVYWAARHIFEAISFLFLGQQLNIDPYDAVAWADLGQIYFQWGQNDLTYSAGEKALSFNRLFPEKQEQATKIMEATHGRNLAGGQNNVLE